MTKKPRPGSISDTLSRLHRDGLAVLLVNDRSVVTSAMRVGVKVKTEKVLVVCPRSKCMLDAVLVTRIS